MLEKQRTCGRQDPASVIWYSPDGQLHLGNRPPLSHCLDVLLNRLNLFLARLGACERGAGGYRIETTRLGEISGLELLWRQVVELAFAGLEQAMPPDSMTPDETERWKHDGWLVRPMWSSLNTLVLAECLRSLVFCIRYEDGGIWVSEIPVSVVEQIRALATELQLHQLTLEQSEADRTDLVGEIASTGEQGQDGWLTVTQAARLLIKDLCMKERDLSKAQARVSKAATDGKFTSRGRGRARRIEAHTFSTWRIKQRDASCVNEDRIHVKPPRSRPGAIVDKPRW